MKESNGNFGPIGLRRSIPAIKTVLKSKNSDLISGY